MNLKFIRSRHENFAMGESGFCNGWFSVKLWLKEVGRSFTHDEDGSLFYNGDYRVWGM